MAETIIAREGRGGKDGEGETRAMRGLRLFRERGDEIVVYLDGTYGVPSRTEEGALYVVDLDRETCECDSHRYDGAGCKHSIAAEAKRYEIARKTAPKPPRKRCSSLPSMAVRSKMARTFLRRMGA